MSLYYIITTIVSFFLTSLYLMSLVHILVPTYCKVKRTWYIIYILYTFRTLYYVITTDITTRQPVLKRTDWLLASQSRYYILYYYYHYVIGIVIIVRSPQLTHDCARWFTTDLYEICGVWPQGQRDARGVRKQVALQAAAVDLPRDQVSGTVDLPGVPRHLSDHQHLLMDHRHFAQVPHFRCVRWVVIALQN